MKLGITIGYSGAEMRLPMGRIMFAERLGYDFLLASETYGSDAIAPLAFLAARTREMKLVTGVVQLAARTPAATAMAAQTIDALAGGNRFVLGLGVSGPQIVEGWYGQPWGRPYYRLRDYVGIIRKIVYRAGPVTHEGTEISLPYVGPGASGLGKPLKSILRGNPNLPIWLGTGTQTNVTLTAEIADGWITSARAFAPGMMKVYGPWLDEGFRRAGHSKRREDFDIQVSVPVVITDDIQSAIAEMKPNIALYVGGMGHKDLNFHKQNMVRRGYGDAADRIQECFLGGKREEAAAAVPDEYCDEHSLIGPIDRIRARYKAWADSGATGITVMTTQDRALELMAELADRRPRSP